MGRGGSGWTNCQEYDWTGMHRAGPGERRGASYGRRAVATAKWVAMQISAARKG